MLCYTVVEVLKCFIDDRCFADVGEVHAGLRNDRTNALDIKRLCSAIGTHDRNRAGGCLRFGR